LSLIVTSLSLSHHCHYHSLSLIVTHCHSLSLFVIGQPESRWRPRSTCLLTWRQTWNELQLHSYNFIHKLPSWHCPMKGSYTMKPAPMSHPQQDPLTPHPSMFNRFFQAVSLGVRQLGLQWWSQK
jgi:hypothetical protein